MLDYISVKGYGASLTAGGRVLAARIAIPQNCGIVVEKMYGLCAKIDERLGSAS